MKIQFFNKIDAINMHKAINIQFYPSCFYTINFTKGYNEKLRSYIKTIDCIDEKIFVPQPNLDMYLYPQITYQFLLKEYKYFLLLNRIVQKDSKWFDVLIKDEIKTHKEYLIKDRIITP